MRLIYWQAHDGSLRCHSVPRLPWMLFATGLFYGFERADRTHVVEAGDEHSAVLGQRCQHLAASDAASFARGQSIDMENLLGRNCAKQFLDTLDCSRQPCHILRRRKRRLQQNESIERTFPVLLRIPAERLAREHACTITIPTKVERARDWRLDADHGNLRFQKAIGKHVRQANHASERG